MIKKIISAVSAAAITLSLFSCTGKNLTLKSQKKQVSKSWSRYSNSSENLYRQIITALF